MMKKFIQPTIFNGLKSNIESIKHTVKRHEERAKKVEELLELYKKECKMIQRYVNGNYQPMGEHLDNINQIKSLEEELK